MYLQIALHPEDRRYHLVLWRPNKKAPVQIYQLNRVTFGVGSSSFLSSRSLIELAILYKDRYRRAAKLILEDIFCDDVISGDRTVELTRSLIEELIALYSRKATLRSGSGPATTQRFWKALPTKT